MQHVIKTLYFVAFGGGTSSHRKIHSKLPHESFGVWLDLHMLLHMYVTQSSPLMGRLKSYACWPLNPVVLWRATAAVGVGLTEAKHTRRLVIYLCESGDSDLK